MKTQVSREAMIAEALDRMKLLDLHPNPIQEFKEEGKLNLSEQFGALFWLNDEQERLVRDWEKKTGNLAYHAIHTMTEYGELLSLLYVSGYTEEWAQDRGNIRAEEALAYVMNLTYPDCSEYGYIGIRPMFGGVIQIW